MMQRPRSLVRDSTNVVQLRKLRDKVDNVYLDDATITCTLNDMNGAPVAGATALEMAVTGVGAAAVYQCTIGPAVDLPDTDYKAVVTATRSGVVRVMIIECVVIDG